MFFNLSVLKLLKSSTESQNTDVADNYSTPKTSQVDLVESTETLVPEHKAASQVSFKSQEEVFEFEVSEKSPTLSFASGDFEAEFDDGDFGSIGELSMESFDFEDGSLGKFRL